MSPREKRTPVNEREGVPVLRKVKATVERYSMFAPGDAVLTAVSGGADSVALLYLLRDLGGEPPLRITVAHFNHLLRGPESDEDERFVRSLAEELGLPFVGGKADVRELAESRGLSVEAAARLARREFLRGAAERRGIGRIATGHHADDQAETVLIRLVRGSGVRGLAAMRPVTRDGFVRPLIDCTRSELRAYLARRGIDFREDSSNLDRSYLRNRVRNELIPLLQREFNPAIVQALRRTSQNMADADAFLSLNAERALSECVATAGEGVMSLDIAALRAYDKSTWSYVFQSAYTSLAGEPEALSRSHLRALADLVGRGASGTAVHLPGGIKARVVYGTLLLSRAAGRPEPERAEKEVRLPGVTELPGLGGSLETEIVGSDELPEDLGSKDPNIEFFDAQEIAPPLIVRTRRSGDRIRPFGFRGTRKLKNLLIDLKIPRDRRDRLPVLADREGVLWVAGVRRSDRARITRRTREAVAARWRSFERGPGERG